MATTRRVAAILAADVAGYSRLMGADEEGTHERLKTHFRELVDPKIKEHHGRTVKNTGDGLLAEFPSIVEPRRIAKRLYWPAAPGRRRSGRRCPAISASRSSMPGLRRRPSIPDRPPPIPPLDRANSSFCRCEHTRLSWRDARGGERPDTPS